MRKFLLLVFSFVCLTQFPLLSLGMIYFIGAVKNNLLQAVPQRMVH